LSEKEEREREVRDIVDATGDEDSVCISGWTIGAPMGWNI